MHHTLNIPLDATVVQFCLQAPHGKYLDHLPSSFTFCNRNVVPPTGISTDHICHKHLIWMHSTFSHLLFLSVSDSDVHLCANWLLCLSMIWPCLNVDKEMPSPFTFKKMWNGIPILHNVQFLLSSEHFTFYARFYAVAMLIMCSVINLQDKTCTHICNVK